MALVGQRLAPSSTLAILLLALSSGSDDDSESVCGQADAAPGTQVRICAGDRAGHREGLLGYFAIYQGHCALLCAGALGIGGLGINVVFDERHSSGDEALSDFCADMAWVIFVRLISRLAQVHRSEQKRGYSPATIF